MYIIQSLKTGSPKYITNIEGDKPQWISDNRIGQAYKFATLKEVKSYLSKFKPEVIEFWHVYKRPSSFNINNLGLGIDHKSNTKT